MIKNGNTVSVHYTGKLDNGQVFDTSVGKDPLVFIVGSGQIIPGFENAIIGKSIGDIISVDIPPSEAYGHIREDLFIKIPKNQLPGEVQVGQVLNAQSEAFTLNVTVTEVNSDHVIVDGNHFLAGQNLQFLIEVVDVKN